MFPALLGLHGVSLAKTLVLEERRITGQMVNATCRSRRGDSPTGTVVSDWQGLLRTKSSGDRIAYQCAIRNEPE